MPSTRKSSQFSPYARPKIPRAFPPITNHLSLSPERSPSPPVLTMNCAFAVTFDDSPLLHTPNRLDISPAQTLGSLVAEPDRLSRTTGNVRSTVGTSGTSVPGSISDPVSEDIPENRKIPKPKGEVGHPGGNGYSLPNKLQWEKTIYDAVQKGVHKLADDYLNTSFGISEQKEDDVWELLQMARQRFPILRKYVAYWPARDMVKLYLKNLSERSRRDEGIVVSRTMRQRNTPVASA
ncbi:hypothetical protein M422DRAFT_270175 [Sphaerobolus stellatus SS14]|uniref:Uncharacterized protein n=1 Tax=Sphaerobolus stellatus (strain SS14) TaxID=990650 RepID=A0A0C9U2V0_SPHS4|nr:hypothetical protein M422DRAFT_270175 [Sphaerobolus stellatus SS14]